MKIYDLYKLNLRFINWIISLTIVTIVILQGMVVGKGYLDNEDEKRYLASRDAIVCFSKGDLKGTAYHIIRPQARPGATLLYLIPNYIQLYFYPNYSSDRKFTGHQHILHSFNYIVYILLVLSFFFLTYKLSQKYSLALISTLVYVSLTNTYMYIRHCLSYDMSLLVLFISLILTIYFIDRKRIEMQHGLILGLTSYFGFSIYPGYYFLIGVIIAIVLFYKTTFNRKVLYKRFIFSSGFVIGSILWILFFEVIAQQGEETSYIESVIGLSKTIDQGSPEEALLFIFKYLLDVEYILGVILIAAIIPILVFIFRPFSLKTILNSPIRIILFLLFLTYVHYGLKGVLNDEFVYYGRIIHGYLPFIITGTVIAISRLSSNHIQNVLFTLLFSAAILQFSFSFPRYLNLSYPKDVINEFCNESKNIAVFCDYENNNMRISNYNCTDFIREDSSLVQYSMIIKNACQYFPFGTPDQNDTLNLSDNFILLASYNNYLTHPAYMYEGRKIEEREILKKLDLSIKIYKKSQ